MDGFQSFKSLCDSIPEWHERLDVLAKVAAERHAEFTRLTRSALPPSSLRRKKTGSMESLRPEEKEEDDPSADPTTSKQAGASPPAEPMRVDIDPDSRRLFQDYRLQSKRKRASPSAASNASGQRVRARHSLVVVYYDSAIQEHFSWLVRTIAGARNALRKGKTAASFRARMAGMGMEESPFRGDRAAGFNMRDPKIPRLTRPSEILSQSVYSPQPFEEIDRELEVAQSLCELGAHQFLREGCCSDEVSGTKERFNAVVKIAKEQSDLYEAEAKIEAEERKNRVDVPREKSPPLGPRSRIDAASAAIERMLSDSNPRSIAVDGGTSHSIAVDDGVAAASSIAVEPSAAVATVFSAPGAIAVDSDFTGDALIAVDPRLAVDEIAIDPAVDRHSIAIDQGFSHDTVAVDKDVMIDSIAVDTSFGSDSIEVDKSFAWNSITVDKAYTPASIAVDTSYTAESIAVDQSFTAKSIAVDKNFTADLVAVDKDYASDTLAVVNALGSRFPAVDVSMANGTSPTGAYRYSTGPIEVDEKDDDGSFHIDLSAFRRTNRT